MQNLIACKPEETSTYKRNYSLKRKKKSLSLAPLGSLVLYASHISFQSNISYENKDADLQLKQLSGRVPRLARGVLSQPKDCVRAVMEI